MKDKENKVSKNIKDQILFATKKELAEKGFNGARIDSIAHMANTTKSLIYYHFKSKENLFSSIFDKIIGFDADKIEKYFDDYIESNNLLPPDKLNIAIHLMVKIHFSNLDPDFQKIINHGILEKRPEVTKFFNEFLIPKFSKLENIILEGIELGLFEASSPILIVINIQTFIMNFEGSKHLFIDSPWKENFTHKNYKENIEKNLTENTFKSLKPKNKKLKTPELTDEVKKVITLFFELAKENR